MRGVQTAAVVLLGSCLWAAESKDPKTLDVPAEKTTAAKALVARFEDDDILVRDKAARDLKAMGREALPALLAARKGKLSERAAIGIADVLPVAAKADFDARVPLFLADKDGKFDHDLPGWNELKAGAKDTKESRQLFCDILQDEECRGMLLAAFDPTEVGRKAFEKRWEDKFAGWKKARPFEPSAPKAEEPIHWMMAALIADMLYRYDYRSYYRGPAVQMYTKTDEGKLSVAGKGKYGEATRQFVKFWIDAQTEPFKLADGEWFARDFKFDKEFLRDCLERRCLLWLKEGIIDSSFGQLAYSRDPKYINLFRRLFDSKEIYLRAGS